MRYLFPLLALLFFTNCESTTESDDSHSKTIKQESTKAKIGSPRIVIHGGAGRILKENMSNEDIAKYQEKLTEALNAGYEILEQGGKSGEAVIAALQILEASPLFNAGVGAVLTHEGTVSHDASFMDGATNQAGAIAGTNIIKSPILAAYMVQAKSEHVMLSGTGAHKFALEQKLDTVSPAYFITPRRQEQLKKVQTKQANIDPYTQGRKMGTVGAVALDQYGNLAAGTSTGGMTNKKYGRIGDSPIIGAGTYANNATCAVSATGHGEFFIRNVVAYDISARMKYKGEGLKVASEEAIINLGEKHGTGGVIALDRKGNIHMPFNTAGMFRGYQTDSSGVVVKLFGDE